MSAVSEQLPDGRYGRSRSADERADRTLKTVGAALGALLVVLIGWFGYHYVFGTKISAEVITFKTSDAAVKVHLEVRKDSDAKGYCTIRSQSADGAEVGRADFRFDQRDSRIDKVVTLRTTARGTSAELLGCHTG
ncbi:MULTISPECIES: DUF4307 domain-containing protein [unclassified Streptomyces]|uniref:DUF4307 domain-containing protein n=1 Tax=unclassified Streptomyces TaxID=2593676 RepID=UPI002DDC15A1|nr:DUF4307 domain-containing protein [Streptomyces sp. NBC_01445]WSE05429.1 DUF4307 domain-containing protein [Streptomyces sp. NBC_01445]